MGYEPKTFSCTIVEKDNKSPEVFLIVVGIVIPFVIMAGSYILIFYKVSISRSISSFPSAELNFLLTLGSKHGAANSQSHGKRRRVGHRFHERRPHGREEREAAHTASGASVDPHTRADLLRLLYLGRDLRESYRLQFISVVGVFDKPLSVCLIILETNKTPFSR